MLITSRRRGRWVLPKGIVEPGLTPEESAAKEAGEEAGITGEVFAESLGRFRNKKWGGTCEIEVYLMKVTSVLRTWPEASFRRREWMPLAEAAACVDQRDLSNLIEDAGTAIEKRTKSAGRTFVAKKRRPRLIHLFRHAKSSRGDPTRQDRDRPLAPRGLQACETMSDYLRLADIAPEIVLCSPALRARQTLQNLRCVIGEETQVRYDRGLYHGGMRAIANRLRDLPETVTSAMIVGHNPHIQGLVVSLCGSGDAEALKQIKTKFPTAGLATLVFKHRHWNDLEPDACELHSFVVPRDIG